MWQRFSEDSRRAILNAQGFAMEMGHAWVDSGHLFLGVVKDLDDNSRVAALLKLSGVQVGEAQLYARSTLDEISRGLEEPVLTAGAKRVMEYAADEAKRVNSETVEVEHFFLGCIREQDRPHVGEVLRPLGLHTEKLRELLREMTSVNVHSVGNPLGDMDRAGKEAIEAAQDAMRASFCGRISTAHLLLGLLSIEDSFTLETLSAAGVDPGVLKDSVRAQIVNDGQIAAPQKKFTPASKRALERARAEAKREGSPLIRPQHLLLALLPRPASVQEKISFGTPIDDPLDKVWKGLPVSEIQRHYEELRALQPEIQSQPKPVKYQIKLLSPHKRDNFIVANFFVFGVLWSTALSAGTGYITFERITALVGLVVLLGCAIATCVMMLFGKSSRFKNLWLNSFLMVMCGMILGAFLFRR